jgi:hypothetical protein
VSVLHQTELERHTAVESRREACKRAGLLISNGVT